MKCTGCGWSCPEHATTLCAPCRRKQDTPADREAQAERAAAMGKARGLKVEDVLKQQGRAGID